jgi:hypothetical protein
VDQTELIEPPAVDTVEDNSMRVLEYAIAAIAANAALLLGLLR